jgi:Transglycosylase SLT domain
MRRSHATILLIALLFLQLSPAKANTESNDQSVAQPNVSATAQTPEDQVVAPAPDKQQPAQATAEPAPAEPEARQLSRDEICRMIEQAANEEALPLEFMARLIWQESRFDPHAVSPVGAQGIAQFMPRTANGRGLDDPFDALPALFESAEYLRELRHQFGNLGLAAAAYNAGPKRVQDWLAKRGGLAQETRNYVRFITGHPVEAWAGAEPPSVEDIVLDRFRCHETPKLAAQRYRVVLAAAIAQRAREAKEARAREAKEAEARLKAQARGKARSRILARRKAQPSSPREQVAKVTVSSKHIRIAAAGKPTAERRKERRAAKAADRAAKSKNDRPNLKIMADKTGKRGAKTANRAERGNKLARAKSTDIGAARRTRAADNTRGGSERRCAQGKGGRKGCRDA